MKRRILSFALAMVMVFSVVSASAVPALAAGGNTGSALESERLTEQSAVHSAETVEMHRLYNPNSGEHLYTGSVVERDLLKGYGWHYEGVAWNAPVSGGTPVYRVYNPNSGDHHYTSDETEREMLVDLGWIYEGVAWNSVSEVGIPLYRLWNPNADCGSHHYTGSVDERDMLVNVGWIYEGIGWYGLLK